MQRHDPSKNRQSPPAPQQGRELWTFAFSWPSVCLVLSTQVDAIMVKLEWPGLSELRDHAVSGVVLPRAPVHDALENRIVRDAERIGLSNLPMPPRASIIPSLSQRFTRAIQVLPKSTEGGRDQHRTPAGRRRLRRQFLVVLVERFKTWLVAWKRWCTKTNLLAAASFMDSLYILVSDTH